MSVSIDGTNGLTFSDATTQNTGGYTGFRNRIINGAMMIDQRNAGASVTPTADGQFTLDRFKVRLSQPSKLSVQRNAGGVAPPPGFAYYLGVTSLSAYSCLAGDYFALGHNVEGLNIADLGFGTAAASPITLSFWVRSSLTGQFSGVVFNNGNSRNYNFVYTINTANTWEKKTITIPGDTGGTWLTDTGNGLLLLWSLGAGSGATGAAQAWSGTNYLSTTGSVNLVSTSGATFYLSGVQLEKGSVATPFEYRPYGTELALCQRYYEVGQAGMRFSFTPSSYPNGSWNTAQVNFAATKRSSPTVIYGTTSQETNMSPSTLGTNISVGSAYITSTGFLYSVGGGVAPPSTGNYWYGYTPWTASSEL